MSQQLTLEIPFKNICGWMQDRRKLPNDWVKKLKAAQIKSEELREAFPSNHPEQQVKELKEIIQKKGQNFIYKDAKFVFTTLVEKTEEGKQKSFLGRYKSPLVYDWQLLLRIYESDNLFLAEYGKIIQQVKGFDLPSMKKQLQSLNKQIQESQQKIKDLKRSSVEQERKFNEDCYKLGIMPTTQQQDLEKQVLNLVVLLPQKFQKLEESLKSDTVRMIIEYYQEFNRYINQEEVLKTLEYANKYGDENFKLYEWRKENPKLDQVPQYLFEKEKHKYDLYNRFHSIVNEDENKAVEVAASGTIDIDWSQIEDSITLEGQGEATTNSWQMVDDPADKAQTFEVNKEDQSKYNQEETIFYNIETRQLLANDLEECEFFLKQRIAELSSKDQATFSMYTESVERKEIVKQCDQVDFLKQAIQVVKNIKNELNDKDTLQLILIRQKPKIAVQRIIQRIQVPLKLKEKQEQNVINLEKKCKEMSGDIDPLRKQIEENEKLMKELVEVVEKELSTKLKAQVKVIE